MTRNAYLRHHSDRLPQWRAAYRARLRDDRDRCDRPLEAARGPRRVFPHRHRRARHQDGADGRIAWAFDHASSPTATRRASASWPARSTSPTTISSAPPNRGIMPRARKSGSGWRPAGDIYQSDLQGLVLGPRRGLFRRGRADRGRGRQEVRAVGRRGDMGRGAELFLPPLGLPGPAAQALRRQPRLHRAARAAQRDRLLRQAAGCKDLSISRTTFDWGIPVPGCARACDVCVDRRAHQLHHRRRLPR